MPSTLLDKPVTCPALIGRGDALDSVSRSLDALRGGQGGVLALVGEAGIGKTRLVTESTRQAGQIGFTILRGNCFEPDRALPYAPFLDLLRRRLAAQPASELAPELRRLISGTADAPPPPDPAREKHRLFQIFLEFFTHLARTPLLIVVEDAHWSDDTSLELLQHLARRAGSLPALLLLTYRSEESPDTLTQFLADLERERRLTEIALKPLTPAEVDMMLRAILELKRPAPADFLGEIFALTEGNPFFIEEVLKSLITAGGAVSPEGAWDRLPAGELPIPRTVRAAVQSRVGRLTRAGRRIVELAAVAGRRFDFALLAALTGSGESELLTHIKDLIGAQLLMEESAEQFAFRHELTRQAVYASLLRRERRTLHQTVGEAMEQIYAATPDMHIADLAFHFFEAGVWDKAFDYGRRAGERALALYAPRAAADQFSRALQAARHLPQAPPLGPVHRARGQAYEALGDFDAARNDYADAMDLARTADDRRAEWQSWIDHGLLWASRDYTRAGNYFEHALSVARELGDPETLAHSLNRMGNWRLNIEETDEALNYHAEALKIFRRLSDRRGEAATLDLLAMASQVSGDPVQGAAYYLQVIPLFRELNDRSGLTSSLATIALCGPTYLHNTSAASMSLAELAEFGRSALNVAREAGWRSGEAFALICLCMCLGPAGQYRRGLELAQRALEISEEIGHAQWACGANVTLGLLHADLLDTAAARQYLERAHALAQQINSSVWLRVAAAYLAPVYVTQQEPDRAEALLATVLAADAPARTQGQRLVWCARGELALARNQAQSALTIADRLIASAASRSAGQAIPRIWKLRGEALAMIKRFDECEPALREAQRMAQAQGDQSLLWRIQAALGRAYEAQARREQAEAEFSAAQNIVTELAAELSDTPLAENFIARALQSAPSTRPPSPRRAAREKFGGLTARERETAALIAQGRSNREIANALVIGERTVETHVGNILSKLNFTSRAQIAAWAVEAGLLKRNP